MRNILALFLLAGSLGLQAQNRYTDQLQKSAPGEGKIVIFQSEIINKLVNSGKPTDQANNPPGKELLNQIPDSADKDQSLPLSDKKVTVNGYRIQVYSGNNSRKGKMEATMMGQRVKSMYSELNVYTRFASPHWICRVGDFKTYEEANEYFQLMKASGKFEEAVIVRSKVTVYY